MLNYVVTHKSIKSNFELKIDRSIFFSLTENKLIGGGNQENFNLKEKTYLV